MIKTIAQINLGNYGSTGCIMLELSKIIEKNGWKSYVCFPKSKKNQSIKLDNQITIGSYFEQRLHVLLYRITGKNGCFSKRGTKRFLKELDIIKPDVIHIHNLHNCYINLKMLFDYIKKNKIKVIWTLHDCWAFTGQCPYFDMVGCEKWKTECHACPQIHEYPVCYIDRTQQMFKLKREWFTGVDNLTLVTPSYWLANLTKKSFLSEYPVKVIHNGIDQSVFKPRESGFRSKYNCQNKILLLGVAMEWGKRKGIDVFVELASRINSKEYQIILIGTDETIDKKLPDSIISIHRTTNQIELAEIYTAADIFVNPTREEVLGLVNLEALACGTFVITFNSGGSPECIDEKAGEIITKDDVEGLYKAICSMGRKTEASIQECKKRANIFNKEIQFLKYIELYDNEKMHKSVEAYKTSFIQKYDYD